MQIDARQATLTFSRIDFLPKSDAAEHDPGPCWGLHERTFVGLDCLVLLEPPWAPPSRGAPWFLQEQSPSAAQ